MKKMGRKHRPFYRICAMDIRVPRDGRVLEELGTYDPDGAGDRCPGDAQLRADQVLAERRRPAVGQGQRVDQEVRRRGDARRGPAVGLGPAGAGQAAAGAACRGAARAAAGRAASRRRPKRRQPKPASAEPAAESTLAELASRHAFRRFDPVPRHVPGIPGSEPVEAGDRRGPGRGLPARYPQLDAGQTQQGRRSALTAAGPAW